jgi:NAD(P)-dependent dehydrogenase (short-subunit alcohol dehydrogenase family)
MTHCDRPFNASCLDCAAAVHACRLAAWLQVEKVVRAAMSRHGRLDGVVNCIGNVAPASALAIEVQQLQQDLQVRVDGRLSAIL